MTKDPLLNAISEVQRHLFTQFSKASAGHAVQDVIGASANMLVNATRQSYHKQGDAEKAFDELFGRMKQVLMNHYGNGQRRDGIFPFNQTIHANLFVDKDKYGGH